jgi:uncharacterized RDD family membrane protein YckC
MSTEPHTVASRAKRFFAFAIDQSILTVLGMVMFIAVFSTQTQQLSNAVNTFFGDPVWSQADKLSAEEFNARVDTLAASPKVVHSVEALAHPFAIALGLSLLVSAAYYIMPTKKWGATLGKYWLKMKVHSLDGALPDLWQSTVRYFAFIGFGTFGGIVTVLDLSVNKAFLPSNTAVDILSLLLSQATWVITVISIIMIYARLDRRGLHDRIAHTIVHDISKQASAATSSRRQ